MKKICSIALAVFMILTCMVPVGAADVSKGNSAADFLGMLGIADIEANAEPITRAAFTEMLVKAMNYVPDTYKNGLFTDVTASSKYAPAIGKAVEMGIITGSGSGKFNPDAQITAEAALKMTVSALGYESMAMAYGGYPIGYRVVANEIGLLKGFGNPENLTQNDAAVLIYNFLTSDICKVKSIEGGNLTQERNEGKTPLSEYFGLTKTDGIIKAAGFVSMIPDDDCDEAVISVGGRDFKTDIENAGRFLGKSASVWYDDDTNTARAVFIKTVNKCVTLNAEEVSGKNGNDIEVYDKSSGKLTLYPLSKSLTFVKNGRNKVPSDADFRIANGSYTLIDNDSDGKYDVVYAHAARYMVVSYVNSADGFAYDNGASGRKLDLSGKNGNHSEITIIGRNGAVSAGAEDLTADTVLTVYESEDGKYVKAVASRASVSGFVTETGTDFVSVDGTEYKVNSRFPDISSLAPGREYTFLLAADGSIAALALGRDNSMKYGMYLDYFKKTSGISSSVQISVMTETGTVIYPELADKVTFDGVYMNKDDLKISGALLNGNIPSYQVIRYSTDEKGAVNKIDTAVTLTEEQYKNYEPQDMPIGDDTLKRLISQKKAYWYSTYNMFSPFVSINDSTVMFAVPTALMSGASKRIDEKDFSVISKSDLKGYGSMTIDAYDTNKLLQPAAVVIYTDDFGSNASVHEQSAPAIVESISSGVNSEGEITKILTYYQSGRFYKMPIDTDLVRKTSADALPSSGDVIRIAAAGNEITAFATDIKYNASNGSLSFTGDTLSDGQVDDSYYLGKCHAHSGSAMTLKLGKAAGYNSSNSDPMISKYAAFTFYAGYKTAVYDTKTNTVKPGKLDMLADAMSVGDDAASNVAIKCYSHGIQHLFIYE